MHWLGRTLAVCPGHRELPERALNAVIAFSAGTIAPHTRSGWSVPGPGPVSDPPPARDR